MRRRRPFEPPPIPPWALVMFGAIGGFYFAQLLAANGLLGGH